MNNRINRITAIVLTFALGPVVANAAPTFNPANGHYYEVIPADGISWTAANTAAMGMMHLGATGHLATLTTAAENTFVDGLRLLSGSNKTGFPIRSFGLVVIRARPPQYLQQIGFG